MSFELLSEACSGENAPHINGFRIRGSKGIATDLQLVVHVENLPIPESIDCFVSSENFLEVYKKTKSPTFTQTNVLTIKEGKFTADLELLDKDHFPEKAAGEPDGDPIDVGNFIDALKYLEPFKTKTEDSQVGDTLWVLDGHAYVTDGNMVLRTPVNTEFAGLVTIPRTFASLLTKVKEAPVALMMSSTSIGVLFEHCWIKSALIACPFPFDNNLLFGQMASHELKTLDFELSAKLDHMVTFGKKTDNVVEFGPTGVSLKEPGKLLMHFDYPMPVMKLRSSTLKPLLGKVTNFSFADSKKLAFSGNGVEGWLSAN